MAFAFDIPPMPPDNARPRNLRRPDMGLYLDRNEFEGDPRSLTSCNNLRIKDKELSGRNMGWEPFPEAIGEGNQYNLDNEQVLWIDTFRLRSGTLLTMFANQNDLFLHDALGPTLKYLTPLFAGLLGNVIGGNVGEVDNFHIVATSSPGFLGTRLTIPIAAGYGLNVKPGDFIHFGSNTQNLPSAIWHEIATVGPLGSELTTVTDPGVIPLSTALTIRQVFTGTNFDLWDGETFQDAQTTVILDGTGGNRDEDTFYITNGITMVLWNGNTLSASWFFPGFITRRFQYHRQIMMAYFINEAGQQKPGAIKTSRLNFPEDFATEEATEFVSANSTSDILRIEPLGDSVVGYYGQDIEIFTFVGPPLFWLIRSAVPGIGILAPGALADFGDFHEILSHDRAYRFDGVTVTEVMGQVMREVLRTQAPNRERRSYVHIDDEQGEAIWSVPLSTDGGDTDAPPVSAFTQHYLEQPAQNVPPPMMQRDFPFTATGYYIRDTGAIRFSDFAGRDSDGFNLVDFAWNDRALQAAFPFSIAGDGDGNLWILSTTSTKGIPNSPFTEAIVQTATFPYFALIDGNTNGHVQFIEPYADAKGNAYNLEILFQTVDRYDDNQPPIDSIASYDLDHSSDRRVPLRVAGRYGRTTFQNDSTILGSFFVCGGYRVSIAPMGDR